MEKNNKYTLAKNLSYYMAEKGIDRTQLCDDLGFKYSTVSEWLSAKKYPRMDKIEMLSNYFGIMKSDLIEDKRNTLTPTDLRANTKPVPLVGRVAAGLSCHAEDNIEGYILTDCELLHEGYEYFWLTVKGDSMEPELHDGDRVLVRQQDTLENECYAVVRIDGEDGVVKRVRVEPDKITLTSVNPYYPVREFSAEDMNNVAIVGPVLEVKRRFHP